MAETITQSDADFSEQREKLRFFKNLRGQKLWQVTSSGY